MTRQLLIRSGCNLLWYQVFLGNREGAMTSHSKWKVTYFLTLRRKLSCIKQEIKECPQWSQNSFSMVYLHPCFTNGELFTSPFAEWFKITVPKADSEKNKQEQFISGKQLYFICMERHKWCKGCHVSTGHQQKILPPVLGTRSEHTERAWKHHPWSLLEFRWPKLQAILANFRAALLWVAVWTTNLQRSLYFHNLAVT